MDADRLEHLKSSEDWREFQKELEKLVEKYQSKYDTLTTLQDFISNRDQIRLLNMVKNYPEILYEQISKDSPT